MGAKPSKSSDDRILRSFNNSNSNEKKKNQFRDVLRRKSKKAIEKQKDLTTPSNCTTDHEIPTPSYSIKRTSSITPYDTSKSKKSRRAASSALHVPNSKHVSLTTSTSSDIGIYSNKSNISSGCWTALSNDPFSQIEASASAFTEITDHSTISRKSLYPIVEPPSYHHHHFQASPITAQDLHNILTAYPTHSHSIIKEAFQRAQQQINPYESSQLFIALNQHPFKNDNVIVYLAKCHLLGLGTPQDTNRGLQLLKSNPSCESFYALGRYYLDNDIKKSAAFQCFKQASEYDITNDSILMTVGEAQCTLARMLFQGEGVDQNSKKALDYLLASAENDNMYAQFLIGVHYERGVELGKNMEKAKEFFRKSADKGFPDAQAALGSRLVADSNYVEGIEWLEKAVQVSNSRAHVQLGILYDKGEGVTQDNETALAHYKAAIEHNNNAAQYILGLVYYFGRLGLQKNHKEAIRLIQLAAVAGLPCAQRVFGQLYQQGNVIPSTLKKNERESIRWLKRAAAGADVIALNILGKCYELGTGVELDLEKALAFYAKAAQAESPYVCDAHIDQARLLQKMARHVEAFRIYNLVLEIGDCLRDKQSIQTARSSVARYHLCRDIEGIQYDPVLAHSMLVELVETTSDPLSHYWLGSIYDEGIPGLFEIDRQKAFHHFLIAADAGDNDATFLVAYMMSNNVVPNKGPADAFPWYQKAAVKGHPMSMYSLGLCYYKGIGQEAPNLDLALEWLERSIRLGVSEAMSYVARIHLKLMVIHADQPQLAQQHFAKAVQSLKNAVEKGDTYAERELGKIYLTGKGVATNYSTAVNLLEKAASKNDAEAITFLGDCYHKGVGVDKNIEYAVEHYLRAANLGYPYAYSAIAELYYEIGDMSLAYDYYLLASKETRIANNDIGKTARMMVARLALGDVQTNDMIDSSKTITPEIAFEMLSTLAIQDQFHQAFQPLGCCYLRGNGTAVNPVQAIFWLRKSAEDHDDSIAYFYLADLFGNGLQDHLEVDTPLALNYLNKSAESGYTEAQYRMGMIYYHGEYNVSKDNEIAATWFKRAASKSHAGSIWMLSQIAGLLDQSELELQYQKEAASLGHVIAMRVLGEKYLKQLEIPFLDLLMQQEYLDEALKYLHMAGDANDTEALVILGKTYNSCTKTKLKFSALSSQTPSNIYSSGSFSDEEEEGESQFQSEEDEKSLAIQCFERASQLGDISATVYAAEAWYEQKQYAAALELFQTAASQGSILARFFCARYWIEGYGGSQLDPERGFKELLVCANELHCVHAYNTLGQCYENGIGTAKNDQLAFEWYVRAAEATHDAEAYYRIALMYAQERIATVGSHKDLDACKYFDLAVNTSPDNHGPSCFQLGLYYLKGILGDDKHDSYVLPPDVYLAIEYFRTAADLHVPEAMLQLGVLFLNEDYSLDEQEEGASQLQRAAELGLREAQFELGLFYHRGKEVVLSNDEESCHEDGEEGEECIIIPQDFEKAYDLFCRSAAQKHPTATYYLGIYHQHGIFVAPDLLIALEQYEIAVDLFEKHDTAPNRWQAEFNLARILHHDLGSRARAYELFQAAHLHAPQEFKYLSKIMITKYHLHGWGGVDVQAEEAASTLICFAQAESSGYHVYLEVAQCFENGLGVEKNLRQAFHWYGEVINKAHLIDQQQEIFPLLFLDEEIEEDEATAMFKLAEFYRQGLVVERDMKKADMLYRLAAEKGSQAAQDFLALMLQKTKLHD